MNIFKYINSKDISEYLEKIGYNFNAMEAVWLIYECRTINFEEKCKAWEEVMQSYPDVKFEKSVWKNEKNNDLFNILSDYIKYKKISIKKFKEKENEVYYSLSVVNYTLSEDMDSDIIFDKYSDVIEYIKNNPKEMEFYDFSKPGYPKEIYNPDIYCIARRHIGVEKDYDEMILNDKLEVVNVDIENNDGDSNNKYIYHMLYQFFDEMWFNFPLPFKKGDIVVDPRYKKLDGLNRGPFVLEETCESLYKDREGSDSSDMIAYGTFVWDDGTIYYECMHNYMNLEYYRDKIEDPIRVLVPISNYLKGEIDITLCVLGYHQIQLELQKENGNNSFSVYDETGKKLAGIIKNEKN